MTIRKGDARWEMGRAGEAAVKIWLRDNGYFVVPVADINNGGAPMLDGEGYAAVLPDLMASMQGYSCWVEVKTKTKPTYHMRPPKRFEHGLPHRSWLNYLAVQEQTGIPGYLAILERESGLLLLGSFEEIERTKRLYTGQNMPGGEAHIFFDRSAFKWHEGPGELRARPIEPVAARTIAQPPAPTVKQLSMFEIS